MLGMPSPLDPPPPAPLMQQQLRRALGTLGGHAEGTRGSCDCRKMASGGRLWAPGACGPWASRREGITADEDRGASSGRRFRAVRCGTNRPHSRDQKPCTPQVLSDVWQTQSSSRANQNPGASDMPLGAGDSRAQHGAPSVCQSQGPDTGPFSP